MDGPQPIEPSTVTPAAVNGHRISPFADPLFAAWQKSGLSLSEIGRMFNRSKEAVQRVIHGKLNQGPLYEALRAFLLDGAPPTRFADAPRRGARGARGARPAEVPEAVAAPERVPGALTMADVVAAEDGPTGAEATAEKLAAERAAALDELADAAADVAMFMQARRRYEAAVARVRSLGMQLHRPWDEGPS